jgi:glucosamine--fructose-6-phosphate aminotransferase (isomerizing)
MRVEIDEIPSVVARFVEDGRADLAAAVEALRAADPAWISLVARGTSDHAALFIRYLIEIELGVPAGLAAPSTVTIYGADLAWRRGAVIAVSQSGRSPDLIAFLEAARAGGARTLAIVNDSGSPLAGAADHVIDCRAGEERSVAATKSYVAQLAAGAALAFGVAGSTDRSTALAAMPGVLAASIEAAGAVIHDESEIVDAFASSERCIVIGRGYDYATALETALKLKETGRLFAEGYSTADFSHGPVVLSAADVPVLVIRTGGRMGSSVDEGILAARAARARPWIVVGEEDPGPVAGADPDRLIRLPLPGELPESLGPLATIVPGQLLAEAVSRRRGYDPDAPPGLRKVTLTR